MLGGGMMMKNWELLPYGEDMLISSGMSNVLVEVLRPLSFFSRCLRRAGKRKKSLIP
jgi:hypothetical protein